MYEFTLTAQFVAALADGDAEDEHGDEHDEEADVRRAEPDGEQVRWLALQRNHIIAPNGPPNTTKPRDQSHPAPPHPTPPQTSSAGTNARTAERSHLRALLVSRALFVSATRAGLESLRRVFVCCL